MAILASNFADVLVMNRPDGESSKGAKRPGMGAKCPGVNCRSGETSCCRRETEYCSIHLVLVTVFLCNHLQQI